MARRCWKITLIVFAAFIYSTSALAQNDCPANVLLALSRTLAICGTAGRDTACYGSGSAAATFAPDMETTTFAQPGDQAAAMGLQTLSTSGDVQSISVLRVRANLPTNDQRSVTLLSLGDVTIENRVDPIPQVNLTATAQVNVRNIPETGQTSEIIHRVAVGGVLFANGRSEDGLWYRVLVPNTDIIGWASAETTRPDGDTNTLNVVDTGTPIFKPFEILTLQTGADDAPCADAPESGILVQAPNVDQEVTLTINDVVLRFAGTLFLQANDTLTVNVLDGNARVEAHDTEIYVPAGARTVIAANAEPSPAEPYLMDDVAALPVMFLETRFAVPQPLTAAEIQTLTDQANTPAAAPMVATTAPPICRYRVIDGAFLYTGPGEAYESVDFIQGRSRIYPIGQMVNDLGETWLQLRSNQAWIRSNEIESEGACNPLPDIAFVILPQNNTLRLETCQTSNGPLRPGQRVSIEFIPRPWGTVEEANDATYSDRGRIDVGEDRLSVNASAPINIGELQYIRVFSAQWTATPGTYRIAGNHLAYQIICSITVPVE